MKKPSDTFLFVTAICLCFFFAVAIPRIFFNTQSSPASSTSLAESPSPISPSISPDPLFAPTIISTPPSITSTALPSSSPSPSPAPISSTAKINVLSLAYYPLRDGRLDTVTAIKDTYGEYPFTLEQVRAKVKRLTDGTAAALKRGSNDYITYDILNHQEILEAVPLSSKMNNGLPLPDYMKMMEGIDVCDWVDSKNVREVWLWTYGGTGKSGWESNFSSKQFGDISNSDRDPNDLPLCSKSYTVYDYNYGREVAEAVHDHTHQYEALLGSFNYYIFWDKFVGNKLPVSGTTMRCGWTHVPPNGQKDYDYANAAESETVCNTWYEDTPSSEKLSCSAWNCDQLEFLVWWMRKFPHHQNTPSFQGKKLRNWWEFIVDLETAVQKGKNLIE